jgi:hypothetical protein
MPESVAERVRLARELFGPGLDEELAELADEWRRRRDPLSSNVSRLVSDPAYLRIIGKSYAALPFLLRELGRKPDHWFIALTAITGVDPIPEESRGQFDEMVDAWLEWGRTHGVFDA